MHCVTITKPWLHYTFRNLDSDQTASMFVSLIIYYGLSLLVECATTHFCALCFNTVIFYFEFCAAAEQAREIAFFVGHEGPQTKRTSSSLRSSSWLFESWLQWSAERSLLACTRLVSQVSQVGRWFLSQENWEQEKELLAFAMQTLGVFPT